MGDGSAVFHVALLPDCAVYRGHFPGHPVCPGVCQVEMARQCAGRLAGHPLLIRRIASCRFLTVATPEACPELDLAVTLQPAGEGTWTVTARLSDSGHTYMELKGEMGV
ncbi:MAG: beta-hydroxyacyl-ACP dehydratase [Candidatus Bacteroides intestinipullorum]|uniref:Beta-hydroxyacyl-ACP dehydratase n=1 Tax=Candidatus Bacteroides intestinipullorum TaxID=2838471 RepID=A0A9E2NPL4_9BACE|nr:beta-hydroxyacyl-ACP dehydratase [Candidatus Bacteroides intestinipullorum]